jgi:hypothetical protein
MKTCFRDIEPILKKAFIKLLYIQQLDLKVQTKQINLAVEDPMKRKGIIWACRNGHSNFI